MAPRVLARMLLEKLRAGYGDRKRGRWVLWGIGAYGVAVLACTAAWLVIGPQAAERTGLRRELFLVNRFAGPPLRTEVSDGISLAFLNEDERFPRSNFSARWRGYWYLPEGGSIAIRGAGDDWLNIYIDGELVLRRYPPDQMHWATEVVTLAAGAHELLVEYEQEEGRPRAEPRLVDAIRPNAPVRRAPAVSPPAVDGRRAAGGTGRVVGLDGHPALGGAPPDGGRRRGAARVAGARALRTGILATRRQGRPCCDRGGGRRDCRSGRDGQASRLESRITLGRRPRLRRHRSESGSVEHAYRSDPPRPGSLPYLAGTLRPLSGSGMVATTSPVRLWDRLHSGDGASGSFSDTRLRTGDPGCRAHRAQSPAGALHGIRHTSIR